jgi:uncharacterized protein (TIGR02118 family)
MAKLIVLYKTPTDASAFDKHYRDAHVAIVKKIPGLRAYELSKGAVASPAGGSGIHLVAILTFDNLADLQAARASPEGQAAAADAQKFATGGADVLMFETADA